MGTLASIGIGVGRFGALALLILYFINVAISASVLDNYYEGKSVERLNFNANRVAEHLAIAQLLCFCLVLSFVVCYFFFNARATHISLGILMASYNFIIFGMASKQSKLGHVGETVSTMAGT
jgi:glucan phosphoethanolaminetransferase (alkaline phosphatase superfamily)